MDQNIGKKLDGRYELTELIGMGGMADVYKAKDIMENKVVAVKILKTEFATNEEFLRRFRNESKAIAVLSHPNIVKIYDVGFSEKIQYIVMEYIDGITLKEYIEQQGVLKWKEAIHFTVQILKALQHAHDRGIVHRDIKPQNIMLFTDGNIKVMDFGIARFARENGKTLSDKTIGSVHYISPEQARGDLTDEKSDIYSVGAMLYEMVTGKKPFEADTPVAVALKHMKEIAVKPTILQPSIPNGLEEIIFHAMQKEADKRYPSASSMMRDLELLKNSPSYIFGYHNYDADRISNDSTIYFNPIDSKDKKIEDGEAAAVASDVKNSKKPSTTLTILLSVTIGVVVIAVLFIFFAFTNLFNSDDGDFTMPNLVGKSFAEVKKQYNYIKFDPKDEYSTEYPEGYIVSQEKKPGKKMKKSSKVEIGISVGAQMEEVPSVVNWDYASAEKELKDKGFKVTKSQAYSDSVAEGSVISTDPKEYEKVPFGSQIVVSVSKGPLVTEVIMPDLLGMDYEKAKSSYGDQLSFIQVDTDNSEAKGTIVSQEFEKGTKLAKGAQVHIHVSTGVAPAPVAKSVVIPITINKENDYKYLGNFKFTFSWEGDTEAAKEQSIDINEVKDNKITINVSGIETRSMTVKVTGPNGKTADYAVIEVDFNNEKAKYTYKDVKLSSLDKKPEVTTTDETITH